MKNIYKVVDGESLNEIFNKNTYKLIIILHVKKNIRDTFRKHYIETAKHNQEFIFLYIDLSNYDGKINIKTFPTIIFYLKGEVLAQQELTNDEESNCSNFDTLLNKINTVLKTKANQPTEEEEQKLKEEQEEEEQKKEDMIRKLREIQKLEEVRHLEKIKSLKEKNTQ